ncbi:MAG: IclR family transcriptional regulator [Pigmentiphaga sp.]|uniref:IclR family transcriptional regulator n=1 Tax=Pigmentiphaga sp. TaxID=1977564 RepID=UPI0029BCCD93|nr:IclR family transcriptional regulator [Pigmentiphaga sp.]MDX3907888.1 IclR family transcriptional regulator [Pigmentiphaga sp.]
MSSTSVMSLRILETMAAQGTECGVTELAERLGLPKARVHRHLSALREQGYVTQNKRTSRYRIGWRLFLLGRKLVQQFDVVSLAKPIMEDLRDRVGQTVVITTFDPNKVVVLDLVRGRSALEILLNPGTQFPGFHTVAQGKIVLAFGPSPLREAVLSQPLAASTPHTITDPDRLRAEIQLVQQRGWAEAPEEIFTGINALAAPIFQADGSLFGALAIVASIHYLPARADPDTVRELMKAAAGISATLGAGESATPSAAPA